MSFGDRLKSEKSHFSNTGKIHKAGVFRWVINIHEHKRHYLHFDNSLLFTEHSEHYTNLSTLNHNVRFLPCQHRGVGIMQYVYALNPVVYRFNFAPTLPQRSSPSGLWT